MNFWQMIQQQFLQNPWVQGTKAYKSGTVGNIWDRGIQGHNLDYTTNIKSTATDHVSQINDDYNTYYSKKIDSEMPEAGIKTKDYTRQINKGPGSEYLSFYQKDFDDVGMVKYSDIRNHPKYGNVYRTTFNQQGGPSGYYERGQNPISKLANRFGFYRGKWNE